MKLVQRLMKLAMKPLALLENKYVSIVVKMFLILYASAVAPKLPMFLAKALKNPVVKMFILFLIVYTGIKDPVMSLLIAVAFTVSMMTLNKLETTKNLDQLIQGAVDVPQSLLNTVVDGAQDLAMDGAKIIGSPVTNVVGTANKVIDVVQDVTNKVIDGAQDLISSGKKQENFSMEDRTISDVSVPDLSSLDGLSGYSGGEIGASVDFKEPETLQ